MLGAITTVERKKERKREREWKIERDTHRKTDRQTDRYIYIARARGSQINKPTYKKKTQ